MKFNGVILKKLQLMDQFIDELKSLGKISAETLKNDWRTARAVERNLQILTEIMIDICQRIISINGKTPASTSKEAIETCTKMGVIPEYKNFEKMVQFRNFVVHRYENIDPQIIVNILNNHLDDFDKFKVDVLNYAKKN